MMRWLLSSLLTVALAGPATAQVAPSPERLREQVVARFMENFRNQAGLTDEQFGQFQVVMRRSFEARRGFQVAERRVYAALEGQMRPGVAADADSVSALIEAFVDLQLQKVTQARREQDEYAAFLNPVQRGQLVLAAARLDRQIEQIVRRRMGN